LQQRRVANADRFDLTRGGSSENVDGKVVFPSGES